MFAAHNHVDTQTSDAESRFHKPASEFVHRCLNREERLVIMQYYAEVLGMEEIAAVLDKPVSEIRDIHEDVVTRPRKRLTELMKEKNLLVA